MENTLCVFMYCKLEMSFESHIDLCLTNTEQSVKNENLMTNNSDEYNSNICCNTNFLVKLITLKSFGCQVPK